MSDVSEGRLQRIFLSIRVKFGDRVDAICMHPRMYTPIQTSMIQPTTDEEELISGKISTIQAPSNVDVYLSREVPFGEIWGYRPKVKVKDNKHLLSQEKRYTMELSSPSSLQKAINQAPESANVLAISPQDLVDQGNYYITLDDYESVFQDPTYDDLTISVNPRIAYPAFYAVEDPSNWEPDDVVTSSPVAVWDTAKGKVEVTQSDECPECGGEGKYIGLNTIEDPCETCHGRGEVLDA